MLYEWMEQNLLLYGMIAAGILGVFCIAMVDHFYSRVMRDLRRINEPKGKWTKDFLSEYMKEKPEWWKWIIIVCVYQTYVAEKPMHPIEVMKIRVRNEAGKTIYECPGKTEDKNTVCYYCVCQAMPDEE